MILQVSRKNRQSWKFIWNDDYKAFVYYTASNLYRINPVSGKIERHINGVGWKRGFSNTVRQLELKVL